ncbi:MAG: hypothetical protein AAFU79_30450, partial [Myxococcota bacterium]
MAARIHLRDLLRMIQDESTPIEEVRAYFVKSPNRDAPFSPGFDVNPDLVEFPSLSEGDEGLEDVVGRGVRGWLRSLALPYFNRRHMRRRQAIYNRRVSSGWAGLRLVAEGDSWFQYPWDYDDDLIDYLMRPYAVYCLSAAGDRLEDMLRQKSTFLDAIKSTDADGLLLSGGGNDIAGEELSEYLVPFDPALPDRASSDYVRPEFHACLGKTEARLRALFEELTSRFPHLKIFLHGYDHPVPSEQGEWLGPTLAEKGIPRGLWGSILMVMIDEYNSLLGGFVADFPGQIYLTNLRGTAKDGGWRDELHLKPGACQRAARAFEATIDSAFPKSRVLEGAVGPRGPTEGLEAVDGVTEVELSSFENVPPEVETEIDLIPDEPIGLEAAQEPLSLGLDGPSLESRGRRLPRVYWPRDDRNAPDYAHLEASPPRDRSFVLAGQDLDLLIEANRFSPKSHGGMIVFALRGAQLGTRS